MADGLQVEHKERGREKAAMEEESVFTLSHCLSLSSRMMTSLGNIWWPFSLNDRFLPSKVTFITYLETKSQLQLVTLRDTSATGNKPQKHRYEGDSVALQPGEQGNLEPKHPSWDLFMKYENMTTLDRNNITDIHTSGKPASSRSSK